MAYLIFVVMNNNKYNLIPGLYCVYMAYLMFVVINNNKYNFILGLYCVEQLLRVSVFCARVCERVCLLFIYIIYLC